MKLPILTLITVILHSAALFAETNDKASVIITEDSVVQMISGENPTLLQIEAQNQNMVYQRNALEQKYQWQWVSSYEHSDSDEKAIASFIPVYGPTYSYATGLQKKFAAGIDTEVTAFSDETSTVDNFIDEATRSGVRFGVSVDLWKNLLGRVDRAELADQRLQEKKSKLEAEQNSHILSINVRKLYWSLVANREQLKIASGLLVTSENQLKDAQRRGKNYISDKAEIARYRAQVSSRRATIKSLEYQRDSMIRDLKQNIPSLADKEIELGEVDIDKTYKSVFTCAEKIGKYGATPWQNTNYDELIEIVEQTFKERQVQTSRYSDVDLKLVSQLQYSGVDQGYQASVEDFNDDRGEGYSVGLTLSVPLGSSDGKAKKARELRDKLLFQSEKSRLLSDVTAQHTQLVKMIRLLEESVQSLGENSESLQASINANRRKYKQARISINDLLTEQDSLLNTNLNEVDAKLLVIHTLLDYFKVFIGDDCEVNKMVSGGKVANNG